MRKQHVRLLSESKGKGEVTNTNILKQNYPKQQFLKIKTPDGKF